MDWPLVTIGFVNCNRLHYLKSCVESAVETTKDYPNLEFIIIDNASIEEGTSEYLNEKESLGFKIVRQDKRDPKNEFAKGLNKIYELSSGKYIIPLQGDSQFILEGKWLHEYVRMMEADVNNIVGCILLDAQRGITNKRHKYSQSFSFSENNFDFLACVSRAPMSCAGDVMYSRRLLDIIYPWSENNDQHEYTGDSETKMLNKVKKLVTSGEQIFYTFCPKMPVSIAIYTDARGTNARIRGEKRYGDYWAPHEDNKYYQIFKFEDAIKKFNMTSRVIPVGIEEVAECIGFSPPIDEEGNWKKTHINPAHAKDTDWSYIS